MKTTSQQLTRHHVAYAELGTVKRIRLGVARCTYVSHRILPLLEAFYANAEVPTASLG